MKQTEDVIIVVIVDNDNVVIAHVDCTAGDNAHRALCDSHGVNGFPTLNIYKDGVKVVFIIDIIIRELL